MLKKSLCFMSDLFSISYKSLGDSYGHSVIIGVEILDASYRSRQNIRILFTDSWFHIQKHI